MKKVWSSILVSLCMVFLGLVVGILLDEAFGGSSFTFAPVLSIIFVIITMGAFILHSIESKK